MTGQTLPLGWGEIMSGENSDSVPTGLVRPILYYLCLLTDFLGQHNQTLSRWLDS